MNVDAYIIRKPNVDVSRLLSDWQWLLKKPYHLVMMTMFGDLFLRDQDGHTWFLDTINGELSEVAATEKEFESKLMDWGNLRIWFLVDLLHEVTAKRIRLRRGECYSFQHPPVLGGAISVDNVEASHAYTSIKILGQIHRQVKDLPPGTVITKINIEGL